MVETTILICSINIGGSFYDDKTVFERDITRVFLSEGILNATE